MSRTVRIRFSSEIYITAENLEEAQNIWSATPLWTDEAKKLNADFIEIEAVEDTDTDDDITSEWDESY